MDHSLGENQVDMDLREILRNIRDLDTGLRMVHLKLPEIRRIDDSE